MARLLSAPNSTLARVAAAVVLSAAPVLCAHALTITPIWGSGITGATNASAIESGITSALGFYSNTFSNNLKVHITFDSSSKYLGTSNTGYAQVSYGAFLNKLTANATTSNDITALNHLPGSDPFSTGSIWIKQSNAMALGLAHGPYSTGTVTLNLGDLNFSGSSGNYDATRVVQHEVDEVLGLGSALGLSDTNGNLLTSSGVTPEDLFRYDANGNRSLTTSGSAKSYFSLNGTTDLARFNQNSGGDYGDWYSPTTSAGCPAQDPRVQDAFACSGQAVSLTRSSVETTALDVIGYTPVAPVPLPASGPLMLSGLVGLLGWRGRRRRAA